MRESQVMIWILFVILVRNIRTTHRVPSAKPWRPMLKQQLIPCGALRLFSNSFCHQQIQCPINDFICTLQGINIAPLDDDMALISG